MAGLYTQDWDNPIAEGMGSALVPSSVGDVVSAEFGAAMAENPAPRLYRAYQRLPDSGSPNDLGLPGVVDTPRATMLSPEDATQQYGLPGEESQGGLKFTAPVTDRVAADLYQAKRAALLRADVIARGERGIGSGFVGRNAIGFAAGLLDPLNLAAGFVPGVGEARFASILGKGMAARAAAGATAGAAGMAALEPLNALLTPTERNDWSMGQALRDIAFGGLLGGGLHVIGGAFDRAPDRGANPLTDRMESAGYDTRDMALRGAVGQTADGRAVNVASALDLVTAEKQAMIQAYDDGRAQPAGAANASLERIQPPNIEIRSNRSAAFSTPAEDTAAGPTIGDAGLGLQPNASGQFRAPPKNTPAGLSISDAGSASAQLDALPDTIGRQRATEALTANARATVSHPADAAADRAAAELRASAPDPPPGPDAALAWHQAEADHAVAQVQAEIDAGRLTEDKAAPLRATEAAADQGEGIARAYEAAAACLMAGA